MAPPTPDAIYSATYSNVPVYEFNIDGNHVMRRRCDDFINATHILKVADYDKPARTRILEREVQKGHHEKIQGGYGKYQGTWIPLEDGRLLAERNGVLDKLRALFDYVPGNVSPPQAPKHTTNVNRAKPSKSSQPTKRAAIVNPSYSQVSDDLDNVSNRLHDEESQDNNSTIETASFMDGDENYAQSYTVGSRKRKRLNAQQSLIDQQHVLWADSLLDYFVLADSGIPSFQRHQMPYPPDNFPVDKSVDDQSHTALHWSAAMGDVELVKYFLQKGANTRARNHRGETPLIRAAIFTNSFERQTMQRMVNMLSDAIHDHDEHGANILHHIVMCSGSSAKRRCARLYLDVVLNKLAEVSTPNQLAKTINEQDSQGDTPLHIAARYNAKKCVRALLGRGARGDIPNLHSETADQVIQSNHSVNHDFVSSSPVLAQNEILEGREMAKAARGMGSGMTSHYHTDSARSFGQSFDAMVQEKGMQMSLALDNELREKDDSLIESQRLIEKVEQERLTARQQIFYYAAQAGAENENQMRALQEEEAQLKAEGLSFAEQLQHRELHRLVRAEEQLVPLDQNVNAVTDIEFEGKLQACLELAAAQKKRRKLTNMLIDAQAAAGMTKQGQNLKILIASMIGVSVDQVVSVVPEVLEELEHDKLDLSTAMLPI